MKKRNNYLKVGYCIFVCAIILMGCSKERSTEERIVMEDVKEQVEEVKKERQEMESGNVSLEENTKDTEDDTEDMAVEPEIAHADWSEYFNGLMENGSRKNFYFSVFFAMGVYISATEI